MNPPSHRLSALFPADLVIVTQDDIKSLKYDWLTDNVRVFLSKHFAELTGMLQNIAFWEE